MGEKKVSKIEKYLSEPWTWVAIATFLIGLWITRGTFTVRINDIENELSERMFIQLRHRWLKFRPILNGLNWNYRNNFNPLEK